MRVEKIATNKVRIFISYEDLSARGIDRDEIWQNGKKVQELFWDMMEVAYAEVGFEMIGPIAVEAFTMPTEGVVVVVTQVPSLPGQVDTQDSQDDELAHDPFGAFVFAFTDFEEVARLARALVNAGQLDASLYVYREVYHLYFEDESIPEENYDTVWAVLHEYGELASVTRAVLDEYGKLIMADGALEQIARLFPT
ncbi:MAG: adaptor protein MecA [Firmicutes bacterium]|nr:adaptor protein MecA [Bacillota bacterium]